MKLEELEVYQMGMEIGDQAWSIVQNWNYFEKDAVGKQLIKASDSIAANISEGYGRYHYKENRQFCYYSRGSAFETITWITKAKNRNLISELEFNDLKKDLNRFIIKLNRYIRSIGPTNDQ